MIIGSAFSVFVSSLQIKHWKDANDAEGKNVNATQIAAECPCSTLFFFFSGLLVVRLLVYEAASMKTNKASGVPAIAKNFMRKLILV